MISFNFISEDSKLGVMWLPLLLLFKDGLNTVGISGATHSQKCNTAKILVETDNHSPLTPVSPLF